MRADRLRFGPSNFKALSNAINSKSFIMAILALGTASGWSACDRPAPWTQHAFASRTSPADPTDVPMPSALWYELIGVPAPPTSSKDSAAQHSPAEGANAPADAGSKAPAEVKSADAIPLAAKVGIETELKPMAIYLIEEVRGTLGGKHHRIEFGPGGGAIDLRDFVTQDRGAFRLVFEFDPRTRTAEETKAEADFERKVLFYSNGKRRRSQQGTSVEWVGDGCDHWLDVTRPVLQAAQGEGLLFAVADARHVSALAGTFFFSVKSPKAPNLVQLARVSFYDSSRRSLLCRI